MRTRTSSAIVFALFALIGSSSGASAAACGGDVSTSGTITGLVDPFIGGGGTLSGTLTINRNTGGGGAKTQGLAFYLVPKPGSVTLPSGTTILYGGVNILNNSSPLQPSLPPPTPSSTAGDITVYSGSTPSGYINVGFGGVGHVDSYSVPVTLTVATTGNLPAGTITISFDIYLVCKGTGGFDDVTTPVLGGGNSSISLKVMSGLRASLYGEDGGKQLLDFQEIGATTSRGTQALQPVNLFVQSSGPYSVDMTSFYSYRLTYPGGDPNIANQRVNYSVTFLGQTVPTVNPAFTTVICHSAGIPGKTLNISAQTEEGGAGKFPSPAYADTLTITFRPLVVAADGTARDCP